MYRFVLIVQFFNCFPSFAVFINCLLSYFYHLLLVRTIKCKKLIQNKDCQLNEVMNAHLATFHYQVINKWEKYVQWKRYIYSGNKTKGLG